MLDTDNIAPEPLNAFVPTVGSPYLGDVLDTRIPSPPVDLHHAFNENQIASKKWLIDELFAHLGGDFSVVYVLGGWYGVLPAMLLNDERFTLGRVLSIDIDDACESVADRINCRDLETGRFKALTGDAAALDYAALAQAWHEEGESRGNGRAPDLVINTSCEHMEPAEAWYDPVPAGSRLVLQSNDYFACPEHVNCVPDLAAFKRQAPMSELRHEGCLKRRKYTRFMLIGIK